MHNSRVCPAKKSHGATQEARVVVNCTMLVKESK